ncbi:uncharacterized protein LOC106133563 [Amyelois transitella]|uniref:uncharacterized protein LOC106133563 n=1 Tax=Amyelois transitella TaxID=680683 RepID=UPI00298FEE19|nr:uncharacterized protein LOC106133563 [Amyelois transitella]
MSLARFPFQNVNSAECELYQPDNVFKRFKVVEFPISFVGLFTTQLLDVEVNLQTSAFLKTMCNGKLMKFEDARELSASHRAFEINHVDEHTIAITFKPNNESISRLKRAKQMDNRFVFDLRLIKIDGTICCENEIHSEIGRYYICGEFEYCNISHEPNIINFGEVEVNTKATRKIRLQNRSTLVAAKIEYNKVTSIVVTPEKFTIPPNSSKKLHVTIKPTCLKVCNELSFSIMNPHNSIEMPYHLNNNFMIYTIKCSLSAKFHVNLKIPDIESLHKINEKNPVYTYLGEEADIHNKRQALAFKYLEISKLLHYQKPIVEKFCSGKDKCNSETLQPNRKKPKFFCRIKRPRLTTYGLTDVSFIPFVIDFGRVALYTYGENEMTIKNNSRFDISVNLLKDEYILYTIEKNTDLILQLKSFTEITIKIFCLGFVEGNHKKTFHYTIDNKYSRKHPYFLQVGNPTLLVLEKSLKFGMVTTESFVTSVPIKIHNWFNVPVDYEWDELTADIPFEIIPRTGSIPSHSCKVCDVVYNLKPSKTKTHEVDFVSISKVRKVIPIELSVITRKISIKFLQQAVIFKDIALNLETVERVKLENSSREIAVFHIVEPLIPGLTIIPMAGTIRPKTIMVFDIIIKIACVLEFSFDVYLKINNKENVVLPVSGNVIEPKLIIHPKLIYMARVPCGMITYVPVTFQNLSSLNTIVEVLDTGDENIFGLYAANGNDKQKVLEFHVEGGQSKTMFIKVYDVFRREYEMYMPFKINGLLGPPDYNIPGSTELQYYIGESEQQYENNPKVKLKTINKDISYCRIAGVITVPWIEFSEENFEIDYAVDSKNIIDFTIKNVSKYYLYVTVITAKLTPNFTLKLTTEENQCTVNDTSIKFEFDRNKEAGFRLKFHPKGHGKFISTAILFLDKYMTIPYSNLTFVGIRQTPTMNPSTHRIIFAPCRVGSTLTQSFYLTIEIESDRRSFSCSSREEPNLRVAFIEAEVVLSHDVYHTQVKVEISVSCQSTYARHLTITFHHECGSCCEVEVSFVFTYCPITLHTESLVEPVNNPYPYFPLKQQQDLFEYLEKCSNFLEKWMFQQGFRRDLYPVIPDTFHAISSSLCSQPSGGKSKGMNVSYLNFVRRIAGPLMKHVRKITLHGVEDPFKTIQEIHDTYREVINLIRNRGANLWTLQAKFLLSYEQFVIYSENITPKRTTDIVLIKELIDDINLFNRLNKQSWIDFILQSYKVFVMDSCFFECVCVTSMPRDIVQVLVDWFNEQIALHHNKLKVKDKPSKVITNICSDLSDGTALASAILNYCPFMSDHFQHFSEIKEIVTEGDIINNACLIIEALNILKLYFPLGSKDFLQPIFLQMLFLSIHLYVTLPMFTPKDNIVFNPPLLRSSTRQVAISTSSQETLIYNFMILNSNPHNFIVEKVPTAENGKKMYLNVKYTANFVNDETCVLLVHGYNKTRIFDTYIIFLLNGSVGSLNPVRKSRVTGPLYRPVKVDVLVSSPFMLSSTFDVTLTDEEPVIPVKFEENPAVLKRKRFYIMRLNLIDKEISLTGLPKESGQDVIEHKLYIQMICLSTQVSNSWIWFRGEIGEFFIRVTSQPRWDLAIDTLQAKVSSWPIDPCSCGESCECYRTTVLMIPHRNELMIRSLRHALLEHASAVMMQVFDQLIETATGKIILGMLFAEGGTNMSDIQHILRSEASYRITSRTLEPRIDHVKLAQHTLSTLPLLVTIPVHDKAEKYSVTFTSDCGMDIRTYKIIFIENSENADQTQESG